MRAYFYLIKQNWQSAWSGKKFKYILFLGIISLVSVVVFTYFFFDYVQNRTGGVVMNDWVLKMIPAKDVSIPIVFFEASVIILFLIRCISNPTMFITFLIAYVFILISRNITIDITQLRVPTGSIDFKDPIAGVIYRSKLIDRDLFYSGHVSLLFLFYLCSSSKADKYYILFAMISVSILLLVQHIHYTVDVVCAPFFAYGCFWLAKKLIHFSPKVVAAM